MANTRTVVLTPRVVQAGVTSLPERAIPDNVLWFGLEISRCTTATPTIWSSSSVRVAVDIELSYDNGSTWRYGGGCGGTGGIQSATKDGAPFEWPAMYLLITPRAGTSRRVRGTITVTGGSTTIGAAVEVMTAPQDRDNHRERFRVDRVA